MDDAFDRLLTAATGDPPLHGRRRGGLRALPVASPRSPATSPGRPPTRSRRPGLRRLDVGPRSRRARRVVPARDRDPRGPGHGHRRRRVPPARPSRSSPTSATRSTRRSRATATAPRPSRARPLPVRGPHQHKVCADCDIRNEPSWRPPGAGRVPSRGRDARGVLGRGGLGERVSVRDARVGLGRAGYASTDTIVGSRSGRLYEPDRRHRLRHRGAGATRRWGAARPREGRPDRLRGHGGRHARRRRQGPGQERGQQRDRGRRRGRRPDRRVRVVRVPASPGSPSVRRRAPASAPRWATGRRRQVRQRRRGGAGPPASPRCSC